MLRNTSIAAALAAASLAPAAEAADVRMYGIIDTGIIVENNRNGVNGTECTAREEFGVNLGPRVGLVANEDLGNGLKVKMQLESLFESDNGAMRFNRLFGGESSLAVIGRFGEFAAGRMGALTSPFGHWGMFGLEATPFGFGWGRAGGVHWMQGGDRLDNALSWASPELAGGLTLYAQYSFQTGSNPVPGVEEADTEDNNRRAALGFKYRTPKVTFAGTVDRIMHPAPETGASWSGARDSTLASLAVNFLVADNVRLYVMGQMFRDFYTVPGTPVYMPVSLIGSNNLADENARGVSGRGFDGYVLGLNAKIGLWGGDLMLTSAYDDIEYKGHVKAGAETGLKRWLLGAAYEYPLSKRTHLYGAANWTHGSGLFDSDNFEDTSDPNSEQVMFGITHFF